MGARHGRPAVQRASLQFQRDSLFLFSPRVTDTVASPCVRAAEPTRGRGHGSVDGSENCAGSMWSFVFVTLSIMYFLSTTLKCACSYGTPTIICKATLSRSSIVTRLVSCVSVRASRPRTRAVHAASAARMLPDRCISKTNVVAKALLVGLALRVAFSQVVLSVGRLVA